MAFEYVTSAADISPELLSAVLERSVHTVTITSTGTTLSGAYAFFVADGESLFAKWTRPERQTERIAYFNQREVDFYTMAGDFQKAIAAPRCFYARASASGESTIILEDLSRSFTDARPANWQDECIDVLADLHGAFWEHPSLATLVGSLGGWRDRIHARIDMMTSSGDIDIASAETDLLHEIVERPHWDAHVERIRRQDRVTLQHGDAHPHNFLFARRAGERPMLIDWQLMECGVPTGDLAYLLVFHGEGELQTPLARYAARVSRPGYTPEDVETDFCRSVESCLLVVSTFWLNGRRGTALAASLERALSAHRTVQTPL